MSDLDQIRDQQLIEERENYEKNYDENLKKEIEEYENSFLDNIVEDMLDSDEFNMLVADRMEYINDHFDFEPSPEYEKLEQLYYQEMEALFEDETKIEDYEYPISEDGSDIEGFDYPEGYNDIVPYEYETVIYDEEDYEITSEEYPEYLKEDYEITSEEYQEYLIDTLINDNDDEHMEKLIEQHLQEEKDYLDSIVKDAIQEGYYFTKAIDKVIFDSVNLDYDNQSIDYEDSPQYWFDKQLESSDDSKNKDSGEEKVQTILKDYYTKDDTLDSIIKDKIKDKKLN